jgi:hypothetical protein
MTLRSEDPTRERLVLLQMLDEAYSKKAWHGPNLKGSIRGIGAQLAQKRPALDRHNIWEIVVHAAYWKYAVRRRLLGEKRGSFPLKGSNWFPCPSELTEKPWKETKSLLDQQHRLLREVVARMGREMIWAVPTSSKVSNLTLLYGIASHDLYHAGQIQLLKRLLR